MYVAATSEGNSVDTEISNQFKECKYLLIVNTDNLSVVAIKNDGKNSEKRLACEVINNNCEAIITGSIDPMSFDILADACVTRYSGIGYSVKKALDLMENDNLVCIKFKEGENKCDGSHHN